MVAQITIRNLQRAVPIDLSTLRKTAPKILRLVSSVSAKNQTRPDQLEDIAVMFISDRRMADLHQRFLQQEGPTDVITFDHGEIFISAETARRNARTFRNPLGRELMLYIIHGLLHLRGFDDRQPKDAREMTRVQERILKSLL